MIVVNIFVVYQTFYAPIQSLVFAIPTFAVSALMHFAKYLGSAVLTTALLTPFSVYAENCNDLDSNPTWLHGMKSIQANFQSGDYQKVTEIALTLFPICSISPTLFYYTGAALEEQGDTERALIYYQKASENLTNMSTDPGTSRKIWYKRYELEHPERTQKAVEEQQEKIETLTQQMIQLEKNNASLTVANAHKDSSEHKIYLWSGIGTGIGGIIFTALGAGLTFSDSNNTELRDHSAHIKAKYTSGWTLLGTGIGLTVIGAALAGYAGYQYNKSKEDAVISFDLAPNAASFSMTF